MELYECTTVEEIKEWLKANEDRQYDGIISMDKARDAVERAYEIGNS